MKADPPISITVVLPAFNEEANLPHVIPALTDVLKGIPGSHEILVINDGSRDRTALVARELQQRFPILRVIDHEVNQGYGVAQRTGFRNARGDLIFINSADGQIPAQELLKYLPAIQTSDIVVGRYRKRPDPWPRLLLSRGYRIVMLLLFGLRFRNINAPKLYQRQAILSLPLQSTGAFMDGEILARAKARGYRLTEVEIECGPRQRGTSSVGFRSAWNTFLEALKFRLSFHT
jgi:glycosyltransferase involved in cell wall biosynthesis